MLLLSLAGVVLAGQLLATLADAMLRAIIANHKENWHG